MLEPEGGGEHDDIVLNLLVYIKLMLSGESFTIYLKTLAPESHGSWMTFQLLNHVPFPVRSHPSVV